ncbi:hypothetical protein RU88_GL002049 [Lactococcus raffinolactis]|nr:hypothetical protein RU88_GL002049 [Lactococcus raffinolactis]
MLFHTLPAISFMPSHSPPSHLTNPSQTPFNQSTIAPQFVMITTNKAITAITARIISKNGAKAISSAVCATARAAITGISKVNTAISPITTSIKSLTGSGKSVNALAISARKSITGCNEFKISVPTSLKLALNSFQLDCHFWAGSFFVASSIVPPTFLNPSLTLFSPKKPFTPISSN